jgi:hypothetical protein
MNKHIRISNAVDLFPEVKKKTEPKFSFPSCEEKLLSEDLGDVRID